MKKEEIAILQIRPGETVKTALKQMDKTARRILFVIDENGRFIGTVTDGDFRTGILGGRNLDEDISGVFNYKPVKFTEDYDIENVKRIFIEKRIEAVPIIDKNGKISDILFWEEVFGEKYQKTGEKLDIPVAIMAGGMGTRFSTVTKILPKPLIPFGEKPVIEVIMDNFSDFGCSEFYLLLGYKGAMIQSYFDSTDNGYSPKYVIEKGPCGTAGSLKLLERERLPGSFFVSNCDIVIKADYADIYNFHKKNDHNVTVVGAMRHFIIPYGVMDITTGGDMKGLTEKPEYDFLVNTGMYVIKKNLLDMIPGEGKFDFTDLLKKTQGSGGKVGVYPVSEKSWVDIGQPGLWEENDSRLTRKTLV